MVSAKEVRRFCKEPLSLIENYDKAVADTEVMWVCHHREEVVDGVHTSRKQLIAEGRYWNIKPEALIFMTPSDHHELHHKGVKLPSLSEKVKGEGNPFFGRHHTDAARAAISEASTRIGQSDYMREIRRKNATGRHIVIGADGKRHWSPRESA